MQVKGVATCEKCLSLPLIVLHDLLAMHQNAFQMKRQQSLCDKHHRAHFVSEQHQIYQDDMNSLRTSSESPKQKKTER